MFSSALRKQKTIQTQDNMLPFCSPDLFIIQNLWPSNRLHRDVWIAGNVCLHNGPVPGSKAGEGLIFLPSACLSVIRIIGVELGGNATNVKQYIPRIGAVLVHNGALCWMGSPSSEGNAPWREKSAFLLRKRHHRKEPSLQCYTIVVYTYQNRWYKKRKAPDFVNYAYFFCLSLGYEELAANLIPESLYGVWSYSWEVSC